jgi:hypothetical protein
VVHGDVNGNRGSTDTFYQVNMFTLFAAAQIWHGFSIPLLVELVRAGLASARAERVHAGNREIDVTRVRITAAGRQALAGGRAR